MKVPFEILIILGFLFSCTKSEIKKVNFDGFTIEVPRNWKKIKIKGKDSYVGGFVTKQGDSIIFDLGYYSNSLDVHKSIEDSIFWQVLRKNEGMDPDKASIVADSIISTVNLDSLSMYVVEYDIIDGYRAKVIYPKKGIIGSTGVYFDSIFYKNLETNVRFNFYGNNLETNERNQLIKAIRTLKFDN